MKPDIRPVPEDDLPQFIDALSAAFLERPDVDKVAQEVRTRWELERTWAAFDGGRVCGTFGSRGTEITVPGGARLPAAAVAAVTVLPTHRRRGVLRGMVAAAHAASRERGEVASLLYASEYPIYGRFGYGPGTRVATWTLDATATSFNGDPATGIELVVPPETGLATIRGVFEEWRRRQPGEIRRSDHRWDHDLGAESAWGERWKGFLIVHRDGSGTVDGYARYRAEEKWEHRQPRSVVKLDELHALTHAAYAGLWRFLAEIDLVATVTAAGRSPGDRLPWLLTNSRAARTSDVGEALWVRLFDVPRALEARTYERSGSVVLEVVDPEASGGRVRVHLDASPAGASCRVTDRSPDLTLDVQALGAAYLGGSRLRDAVLPQGADEHRAGALRDVDALLHTLDEPWCSTFF
jgi:predicted acetyltransferase